jgi:Flp pilus assembly protein TadG
MKLWQDQAGSAMLEMAVCSLVILTTILGIMECSLALYNDHFASNAARDGARYAMVRGSTWADAACNSTTTTSCEATNTDVTNYVRSTAPPGITASSIVVTTTWPGLSAAGTACDAVDGSNSPGCIVQVSVSCPFTFMLPAPSALTIHLRGSSVLAISQ